METLVRRRLTCRICDNPKLQPALSFGATPLANALLSSQQLHEAEKTFPLEVKLCTRCGLLQLEHVVSPKILFTDYLYASSTSPVFQAHFEKFANDVIKRFQLKSSSLVIDIGSNDGILLKPYRDRGVQVLGIDPARQIAQVARAQGIPTEIAFFDNQVAKKIRLRLGGADVMTATNVFAHIDDIAEIAKGVKTLLKPDGVFIVEVPYLVDFLRQNIFDTVYHEHVSYYSVAALQEFFRRQGMVIIDVQKVTSHGGSLRVFVKRKSHAGKVGSAVRTFLECEQRYKLKHPATYRAYAQRIAQNRLDLLTLLTKLKKQGKTIAGYGAPAKATTLLNVFGIGTDLLEYIVDDSPLKQGRFLPGKRIPIVSSAHLIKNRPDYLLIIAWNFAQPIMEKQTTFRAAGGKFIIPVPRPIVV